MEIKRIGAGDVPVQNVPDPSLVEPTNAIHRVVRARVCGKQGATPFHEQGVWLPYEVIP